ncbi:MAG: T9SS type A sorting domain-containing protein [Bacteroidota bacterium]|nr:T9SS type A sorting domain-containing protein [Bacteroidota bacterium]
MRDFYLVLRKSINFSVFILALFLSLFQCKTTFAQTVVVNPGSPWTVPAGVTSVKVEVWGGGGGGGGAAFGFGGGGGGGAYNTATFAVSAGQSYTISRGAGGSGGSVSFFGIYDGGNGGTTTVSGPNGNIISANGGYGGTSGTFNSGNGGNGAAGGAFSGGNGSDASNNNAGAGGGGAGNTGNGNSASGSTAGTGGVGSPNNSTYRGGNGGNAGIPAGPFSSGDGGIASVPGGGGGGAFNFGGGGNGGSGQVVLTYTSGPVAPTVTGFSPNPACVGNLITITGNDFVSPATVTFYNGLTVSATVVNSTKITATLPSGATTGGFTVTTSGGTSAVSANLVVTNLTTPLSVSGAGTYCGSASLAATGGSGGTIYFEGTNSNGTSTSAVSPQVITATGTHTYYFREYNNCGWGTAYPATVTVNPLPSSFTVNVNAGCSSAVLTPSGATGDVFYFQGTTAGGTSTTTSGPVTVTSPGTYYYRAKAAGGCWGDDVAVPVVFQVTAVIGTQPVSQEVCSGTSVDFSVAVTSGTTLSYQWRNGNTNISNGGNISGATTNKLSITGATNANAATDYNCLITDACGSVVSDYVSLTINQASTAPANSPTGLNFAPIGVTSAIGGFNYSADATFYIVIRSTSSSPVPKPVNGTSYTQGSAAFGANTYVEYIGTDNYFTSSGLSSNTNYYYWVYAFNENSCGTSPLYNSTPSYKTIITNTNTTCNSITDFYWMGSGSDYHVNNNNSDFNNWRNWSTSSTQFRNNGHAIPDKCTDVYILVNTNVNITLSNDADVHAMTFILQGSSNNRNATLTTRGNTLSVYDDATINITSGSSISIGEQTSRSGIIDFKGNVSIGSSGGRTANFIGNSGSTIIFRGDLNIGSSGAINEITDGPGTAIFDGVAQKISWKNSTSNATNFNDVEIGSSSASSTVVSFDPGSTATPGNILGNLTINGSSQLWLGTSQWNRDSNGGIFTMNNTSKLQLGGSSSVQNGGSETLVTGSNFPSGFSTSFNASSTVEYNGKNNITQTVYSAPQYGNLTLTNGSGSGTANKNSTASFTISGTATVQNLATLTMGAGITANGPFNVNSGASLICGANVIGGSGSFTLQSNGNLSLGSAQGISASGATGNIQVAGARSFNTAANYTYNGLVTQVTGNGLPSVINNLSIINSAGVTLTADNSISGIYYQTTGPLALNSNTLTINQLIRSSGTISGSDTSNITINGTSIPLIFTGTPGAGVIKNLKLNDSKSAYLGTTLDISGGIAANTEGSVTIGNGSVFTTNDHLTLKSSLYGTARIGVIPVDASGNPLGQITGNVTVERYTKMGSGSGLHGKKWLFLAIPTIGQTVKQSWMENGSTASTGYGIQVTGPGGTGSGFDMYSVSPSMKYFDNATGNWKGIANTNQLIYDSRGYMVFIRGDRSVNGTTVTTSNPTNLRTKGTLITGDQTISLPGNNSFASIGNPYASAIDMRNVTQTNGSDFFYVWNPSLGGNYGYGAYETYVLYNGNYVSVPGFTVNNSIQSGQAFFVQTSSAPANVLIKESSKQGNSNSSYFRPQGVTGKKAQLITTLNSVNADSSSVLIDGTLQQFSDDYTNAIDAMDERKIFNASENISIKSAGKNIIVERRHTIDPADTIFLSLTRLKAQNYRLVFDAKNLSANGLIAFLEDNYMHQLTTLNLDGNTEFNFRVTGAPASYAPDRFHIIFRQPSGPLPVTFTSVNAYQKNSDISVNWKVENESNMKQYEVEKSTDGSHFVTVATIAAINGTANSYSWLDKDAVAGYNYYRIRSVDINQKTALTQIVKVNIDNVAKEISIFPNPVVNGVINLHLINQASGNYKVRILNQLGQVVQAQDINHSEGSSTSNFKLTSDVAHGIYQAAITSPGGEVKVVKFIY